MSSPHSEKVADAPTSHPADLHVGLYLKVGLVSVVFTSLTVLLSFLTHGNILIAMILATCNAAMVLWFTMHLKSEKASIYRAVFFSLFFVIDLFLVTLLAVTDRIHL